MRAIISSKAFNGCITNRQAIDDTSKLTTVVNGFVGFGLMNKYFPMSATLHAKIACVMLEDVHEDITLVNKQIDTVVKTVKTHIDIESRYVTVKEGQWVDKGQTIAFMEKEKSEFEDYMLYHKTSKEYGVVKIINKGNLCDIVVTNEYHLDVHDGVKIVGFDAQKSTTHADVDRFEVAIGESITENTKEAFRNIGVKVEQVEITNDDLELICDADSIFRRNNSGFLANMTLGYEKVPNGELAFDEAEWNKDKRVYMAVVRDTTTGMLHDAIVGIACFAFGMQTPAYELKVPKNVDPLIGNARNAPSLDIFSKYVMSAKVDNDTLDIVVGNKVREFIDWEFIQETGEAYRARAKEGKLKVIDD